MTRSSSNIDAQAIDYDVGVWWLLIALVLGLAGCDQVFGLEERAPSCTNAGIFDGFDVVDPKDPGPCRPWGFVEETGSTVRRADGRISITPDPHTKGYGGCTAGSAVAFLEGGIFLEVSSILNQPNGYVLFDHFELTPPDAISSRFLAQSGHLYFLANGEEIAMEPFDPIEMRWWRLRPEVATSTLIAEYSANGNGWTQLGATTGTLPISMKMNFGAGAYDATVAQPATATFEGINVCP